MANFQPSHLPFHAGGGWNTAPVAQHSTWPKLGIADTAMPPAPAHLALWYNCGDRKSLPNLIRDTTDWETAHMTCQVLRGSISRSPSQDSGVPSMSKTSSSSAPCIAPLATWVQWTTPKLLKPSFSFVWHNGCGKWTGLWIFIERTHPHRVL